MAHQVAAGATTGAATGFTSSGFNPWGALIGAGAGGLAGYFGGGEGAETTTPQIPPWLQSMIKQLLGESSDLYGRLFEGDFVAEGTPEEQAGFEQMAQFGADPRFNLLTKNFYESLIQKAMELGDLDPNTNKALGLQLDVLQQGVQDRFEQGSTRITSQANQYGALSGSRADILQTQLTKDAAQVQQAGEANLLSQERSLVGMAPGLFQGAIQAGLAPGQIQAESGRGMRGLDELQIQNELAKFFHPQQQAESRAGMLAGFMPGFTGQRTETKTNPWFNAFQGMLGGTSLGTGIANLWGQPQQPGQQQQQQPQQQQTPWWNLA